MALLNKHPPPWCLPVLAMLWVSGGLVVAADRATEYELKAAFLYKFASFVEWPVYLGGPVCICVVGEDPFGPMLDRVVREKSIGGRPFVIRRFKALRDGSHCQIVFIASSEQRKLKSILDSLPGPVLTVGDTTGFCERGGIIDLEVEDEKVHLRINPEAAERARLRLSSKLLSLATLVHAGEE